MQFNNDDNVAESAQNVYSAVSIVWKFLVIAAVLLPCLVAVAIYHWSRNRWANHPIAKRLGKFADADRMRDWRMVAANINDEYRRDRNVVIRMNPISRIVATESWIIKTTSYWMNIAHQDDTALIAYKVTMSTLFQFFN